MEIISKEEMNKEPWRGRGHSSKVFRAIISLEPGQVLRIEPQDWGRKYPPSAITRYIQKKYNRTYVTLRHAAGKGWAVERIK